MNIIQRGSSSKDCPGLHIEFYSGGVMRYSPYEVVFTIFDPLGKAVFPDQLPSDEPISAKAWCKSVGLYVPIFIVDEKWLAGTYTMACRYKDQHTDPYSVRIQQFEVT